MVFNILSRRNQVKSVDSKLATFSSRIADAFMRIKGDIISADQRISASESELSKLNQWIGYLYHSQQQIHHNHSNLQERHADLRQKHLDLSKSHTSLSRSIDLKHAQVKSDISGVHNLTAKEFENIKDWIKHFADRIEGQRDIESKLRKDVSSLHTRLTGVLDEIREEVSSLKSENSELKDKVASLENVSAKIIERPVEIKHSESEVSQDMHNNISAQSQAPVYVVPKIVQSQTHQSGFEKHILSRVRPNRKNFVMDQILNLIEDNKYSTKEVEEIIVNEKELCGRTSFYSYLRELKHRGKINYADIGEKTILVMTKD